MKVPVQVTVNNKSYQMQVDTRMVLADMLRDELRLTGTHVGCGTGSCGACTVMLNGETVKSCCILAARRGRPKPHDDRSPEQWSAAVAPDPGGVRSESGVTVWVLHPGNDSLVVAVADRQSKSQRK